MEGRGMEGRGMEGRGMEIQARLVPALPQSPTIPFRFSGSDKFKSGLE
jgi:hypothetical protein